MLFLALGGFCLDIDYGQSVGTENGALVKMVDP